MDKLARAQLLILDDFATHSLTDQQRFPLLELVEERYQRRSTLITAQVPISAWHDLIGDATVADAILDRIVHNAHRISLEGDSRREQKAAPILTGNEIPEIMAKFSTTGSQNDAIKTVPDLPETPPATCRNQCPTSAKCAILVRLAFMKVASAMWP
jgi:IstB-like ATP binding protein